MFYRQEVGLNVLLIQTGGNLIKFFKWFFTYPLMIFGGVAFGTYGIGAFLTLHDVHLSARAVLTEGKWVNNITEEEAETLRTMLEMGEVISPSMLLDGLSSFYANVFQLQLALLTGLGIIAFFYIKGVSKAAAEEMAEKEVKSYIQGTEGQADIEQAASEIYGNQFAVMEDLKIEHSQLKASLSLVEKKISEMASYDDDDDIGGNNLTLNDNDPEEGG